MNLEFTVLQRYTELRRLTKIPKLCSRSYCMAKSKMGNNAIIVIIVQILTTVESQTPDMTSKQMCAFAKERPPTCQVLEGTAVDLICHQPNPQRMNIYESDSEDYYVSMAALGEDAPGNFKFNVNETTGVLAITNISRDNEKTYTCILPEKRLTLDVMYRPPTTPRCSSNYPPNSDKYDFHGQLQDEYQFNCTTGEGDPVLDVSIFMYNEEGEKEVSADSTLIFAQQNISKTLLYTFSHSSLIKSIFVCVVSQSFPEPYESHSYNNSCSLEIVPYFSVIISPQYSTIIKGGNVTIICTSDHPLVHLNWTNVPDGWAVHQSNETSGSGSIYLTIVHSGPVIEMSFTINCSGDYDERRILNSTIINVRDTSSKPTFFGNRRLIVCTVVIVAGIVVILICVIIVISSRKKVKPDNNGHTSPATANTSENNANDTTLSEGKNAQNIPNVNHQEDYNHEMVNNPVYWSYQENAVDDSLANGQMAVGSNVLEGPYTVV